MSLVTLPIRSVIPWYMETTSEVLPNGWVIAMGQTLSSADQDVAPGGNWKVPDLRNRMILGADLTKAIGAAEAPLGDVNIDTAAGAPGCQTMSGAHGVAITISQMAVHSHVQGGTAVTLTSETHNHTGNLDSRSAHSHGGTTGNPSGTNDGGHAHGISSIQGLDSSGTTYDTTSSPFRTVWNSAVINNSNSQHNHGISTDAAHGHTISAATLPAHTHTYTLTGGTTNSAGSGGQHESRPSYASLIYIIKVKN